MKKLFGLYFMILFGCQVEPCYIPYGIWEVTYTPIESDCLYQEEYKKVIQYDGSIEDLTGLAYNCNGYKEFIDGKCRLETEISCIDYKTDYPVGKQKSIGKFFSFKENSFKGEITIQFSGYKDIDNCYTKYKVYAKKNSSSI